MFLTLNWWILIQNKVLKKQQRFDDLLLFINSFEYTLLSFNKVSKTNVGNRFVKFLANTFILIFDQIKLSKGIFHEQILH